MASCSHRSNNEEDINSTYNSWNKSFSESVINETNLLDFQKENLINISNNISVRKFTELKQSLLNKQKKEISKEYLILELSEGEVLTAYFYYVVELNNQFQSSYINLYEDDNLVFKLNKSHSEIQNLISVTPINDQTLDDTLFILTTFSENRISTTIGSGQ